MTRAADEPGRTGALATAFAQGNQCYQQGRFAQAEESYRQVLRLDPGHAAALGNLGAAVADQGRHEEAIALYEQSIRLDPLQIAPRHNLTNSLRHLGRMAEAEIASRELIQLSPRFAPAHLHLGIALLHQRRLDEAETAHLRAVALDPESPAAWTSLGLVRAEQGRLDEGLMCYEQALRLRPGDPDAHRNRSLAWLLMGNLAQGFPEYEWRWRCADFQQTEIPQPRWMGESRPDEILLLYTEQGLGDTLQFVRYAAIARERVGAVWLVAQERLLPLLSRCTGIDRLLPVGSFVQGFDRHAPLLSLPAILGTSRATVPRAVPYLHADPARCATWSQELQTIPGYRVGIAWHADPKGYRGAERSIPLRQFSGLAAIEGVRLVGLQHGPGRAQRDALAGAFDVIDLGDRLDREGGAFEDTAAVMRALDLVITCDTSIAHLAGGLGVPCWVALPRVPDWRWLLDLPESPWYPGLRLYRQEVTGDWGAPFTAMARDLAARPVPLDRNPNDCS